MSAHKKLTPPGRRQVIYAYAQGASMSQLGREHGVTRQAIASLLRAYGVKAKPRPVRLCSEPGCTRKHHAHGRCRLHEDRHRWSQVKIRAALQRAHARYRERHHQRELARHAAYREANRERVRKLDLESKRRKAAGRLLSPAERSERARAAAQKRAGLKGRATHRIANGAMTPRALPLSPAMEAGA